MTSPWPPPPLTPKPTFREVCWRMVGPSNRPLTCDIIKTATGLEVRVLYAEGDFLNTQLTPDLGTARELAARWRAVVVAKSGFHDLDAPEA